MTKAVHPNRFVTFTQDHVEVTPATVLEGFEPRTGVKYVIAEVPEARREYTSGQELQFGSVNAARAFVKALGGVCRLGRKTETVTVPLWKPRTRGPRMASW